MSDVEEAIPCAFLFREPMRVSSTGAPFQAHLSSMHDVQLSLQLLNMLGNIVLRRDAEKINPTESSFLGYFLAIDELKEEEVTNVSASHLTRLCHTLPHIIKLAKEANETSNETASGLADTAAWTDLEESLAKVVPPLPELSEENDCKAQSQTLEEPNASWRQAVHWTYFDALDKSFIPNFEDVLNAVSSFGEPGTPEYRTAMQAEANKWSWSFAERTAEQREADAKEEHDALSSLFRHKVFLDSPDGESGKETLFMAKEFTEEPPMLPPFTLPP